MYATEDNSLSSHNKPQVNFYNSKNEIFIIIYILGKKGKAGRVYSK